MGQLASLRSVVLVAAAAASVACAATQPIRVLPKGESRWISSVGGPLLPHHAPTGFIPYTNVGRMWGQSDNLTLSANLHVLAAAFGVAGVDVGAARRIRAEDGLMPELTGQAQIYAFAGSGGARVYPNFTGIASWTAGPRTLLYGGSALTIRPSGGTTALVTPLLGIQRDVGKHFAVQLEGKWMAANIDMRAGLFEGENSVDGKGGLSLQLGVQVKR